MALISYKWGKDAGFLFLMKTQMGKRQNPLVAQASSLLTYIQAVSTWDDGKPYFGLKYQCPSCWKEISCVLHAPEWSKKIEKCTQLLHGI